MESDRGRFSKPLATLVFVGVLCFLGALFVPSYFAKKRLDRVTECQSNLQHVGKAVESYRADVGSFPATLDQLTQKYLPAVPVCPSGGEGTYVLESGSAAAYNSKGAEDYFFLQCSGSNHTDSSVPSNYPQYDSVQGLIYR